MTLLAMDIPISSRRTKLISLIKVTAPKPLAPKVLVNLIQYFCRLLPPTVSSKSAGKLHPVPVAYPVLILLRVMTFFTCLPLNP